MNVVLGIFINDLYFLGLVILPYSFSTTVNLFVRAIYFWNIHETDIFVKINRLENLLLMRQASDTLKLFATNWHSIYKTGKSIATKISRFTVFDECASFLGGWFSMAQLQLQLQ